MRIIAAVTLWVLSVHTSFSQVSDTTSVEEVGMEIQLGVIYITESADKVSSNQKTRSMDQLLHDLPGVQMVRRGNFANEPLLRGLSSERYTLTIDGMRIYGACTDKMDPASSYIEPINLQSIDVNFGSQSDMLGSNTGGNINFGLKQPIFSQDHPIKASIRGLYSSVNQGFDQAMDLNLSRKKVALRLSGVHRKAENYRDGNGEIVRYSQYEKFNYQSSLSYRVSANAMIQFDFLGDDARDVGYPALPMDVSFANARIFSLTYFGESIAFLKQPEIKIYHNTIDHEMDDTKRDSVAMHMDMPGNSRTSGGYIKGYARLNEASSLQAKLEYINSFWHAEMTMYPNESNQLPMFMLTWPDVHRSVSAGELKYEKLLHPNISLTSNARVEHVASWITSDFGERQLSVFGKSGVDNRVEILISASSGLQYKMKNGIFTEFTLSYGERVPSVSEQYGFYLFNRTDGYDYLGDPDLEKETNFNAELTTGYQSSNTIIKGSIFHYYFTNYILGIYDPTLSNMTIGALGVKWYQNTSHATMMGGELNVRQIITPSTSFNFAAKYVYGNDFAGNPLPQIPPFKINASINQEFKGWSIQPEVEWSAAQERISEIFNERTTPSYTLFNLLVSKSLSGENLTWNMTAGVENITDVAYREHFDVGNILRSGRNVTLQIACKF